jgi:hypothetical protein
MRSEVDFSLDRLARAGAMCARVIAARERA